MPGPADLPELGAFARMWKRDSAAEIAAAMHAEGLTTAQWNFSALGQSTVSGDRACGEYAAVRADLAAHGLTVWGLSATFNLLDPDPVRRSGLIEAAVTMTGLAPALGATAVTICTGSRAPDGWTYHPGNGSPEAWREMRAGLDRLLAAADAAGVIIGVEPERGCVVADTASCVRLLAEAGPGAPLGVVLDAWNLAAGDPGRPAGEVLAEAFAALGPRTVCLQAKDPLGAKFPAGPVIDYAQVARLHAAHARGVPVVLQDVAEQDVGEAVAALRAAWAAPGACPVPGHHPGVGPRCAARAGDRGVPGHRGLPAAPWPGRESRLPAVTGVPGHRPPHRGHRRVTATAVRPARGPGPGGRA